MKSQILISGSWIVSQISIILIPSLTALLQATFPVFRHSSVLLLDLLHFLPSYSVHSEPSTLIFALPRLIHTFFSISTPPSLISCLALSDECWLFMPLFFRSHTAQLWSRLLLRPGPSSLTDALFSSHAKRCSPRHQRWLSSIFLLTPSYRPRTLAKLE